jgi:preprotein translocase subunit YajC
MTVFTGIAQNISAPTILAQAAGAGGAGGFMGNPLIFMGLMMIMMYFLLIRPQRQKQKEAENTQKALQAGDEVVTIGGAHGVVTSLKEKTVIVRMVEGKVEFDRSAIALRIPKNEDTIAK